MDIEKRVFRLFSTSHPNPLFARFEDIILSLAGLSEHAYDLFSFLCDVMIKKKT